MMPSQGNRKHVGRLGEFPRTLLLEHIEVSEGTRTKLCVA